MKIKITLLAMILVSITCHATNYYWVNGSGNWSDTLHWATTSGGTTFQHQWPQPTDNVFFDGNSFTAPGQIVTIDQGIVGCGDMTWTTSPTAFPTLYGDSSKTFRIWGSLALANGMSFNYYGQLIMESLIPGKTITSGGTSINTSLTFNGAGGGWTLMDALTVTKVIYFINGSFNTNNQTVNAAAFYSTGGSLRSINLGSSTFNLKGYTGGLWNVNSSGLTFDAGTSTINGTSTIGIGGNFYGGGLTYYNLSFADSASLFGNNTFHDVAFVSDGVINGNNIFHDVSFFLSATINGNNAFNNVTMGGNGIITSSNNFSNLNFSPGWTYTLQAGATQTVGNICAQGTGTMLIRIQSSTLGMPATILKVSGGTCWDYVHVSDITATGGAIFNAGLAPANSMDLGGNTGLLFTGGCSAVSCTSSCTPPSITLNPTPTSVCVNNMVFFTIAAAGTDLTYQWQVDQGAGFTNISNFPPYNGVTTNTLNIMMATSTMNGYQYRCAAVGACPLVSMSSAATLTITPSPIVTVNSANICSGQSVTLTASGATSYFWPSPAPFPPVFPPPPPSGATTASITVSPIITTSYPVIGTTNGCSSNAIATVTVSTPPIVTASVSSSTVTVSATGGTPPYTGTGVFTGLAQGTYTYTVTDANGCTGSATATVANKCTNAASIPTIASCLNANTLSVGETEKWFSFTAGTENQRIQLKKNSASLGNINTMGFYSGTCSSLNLVDSVNITFTNDTLLTLNESNLTTGSTYYIKTSRCNGCANNIAKFDVCLIPINFDYFGICYDNGQNSYCCYNTQGGWGLNGTYNYPNNINFGCPPITVCNADAGGYVTFSPGAYNGAFPFAVAPGSNYIHWIFPAPTGSINDFTLNSHTIYFNTGTYQIYAEYMSPNGMSLSGVEITVNVLPGPQPAVINSILPNPGCVNNGICISSTAPSNSISLDWGDGTIISNGGPGGGQYTGNDCHSYTNAGTYTAIITSTNNCGSSAVQQQITVNGITTQFTATTVCFGSPSVFTDQSSCYGDNTTWLWHFGDGSSSTLENPSHTYSSPGSYTVTLMVTNSDNSISNTVSQIVIVNPTPPTPLINGSVTACQQSGNIYTITNYNSSLIYNVPSILPVNAGISTVVDATGHFTINWTSTNGGTIIVTVTSAAGCSTSSSLYVGSCCSWNDPSKPNFNNGNNVNTMQAIGGFTTTVGTTTTITTKQFSINGTFTVNKNLTLKGCTVKMGYLAKIIVAPGITFTITDNKPPNNAKSHIYACNEMWDGIHVPQASSLVVINNGSTIEDALNAVVSDNLGNFQIFSTPILGNVIFNKNFKSIVVDNPLGIIGTHPGLLSYTTIECHDGIGLYSSGTSGNLHYPHSTVRSDVGVEITSISNITIGDPSNVANVNTFNNLDNGIRSYNASVNVYNNKFQAITYTGASITGECFPGIAICASGPNYSSSVRTLNVGSSNTNPKYKNTFVNCYRGVDASISMNAAIWNNTFTGGQPAIRMTKNYGCTLTANSNTIGYAGIGIDSYDNRGSSININSNVIDAVFVSYTQGIRAGEIVMSNHPTSYTINGNIISNVLYGVNASGLSTSSISVNTIILRDFTTSNPGYGVSLTASAGCLVDDNSVTGQNNSDLSQTGIIIVNSVNDVIACNHSNMLGAGLFFGGSQGPATIIEKNQMNNNLFGFLLYYGYVGPQGAPHSPSDNQWTGTFTLHTYSYYSSGGLSPFYVRAPLNTPYHPSPYLAYSFPIPSNWVPLNSTNGVNTASCPKNKSGGNILAKAMALKIAGDSIIPAAHIASTKSMLQQSLYNYLQTDSLLVATEPLIAQFKAYHSQHNLGKFGTTATILGNPLTYNVSTLQTAQTLNNAVSPSSDVETNSQWMNSLLIDNAMANIDFTAAQLTDLRVLAAKCPYSDGNAVFQARTIMSQYDTIIYSNVCETILPNNQRSMMIHQQAEDTISTAFKLYPNPNNGSMLLDYTLNENEKGEVKIYDITGKLVGSYDLENTKNQLTIASQQLTNGVYVYHIIVNNNIVKSDKLIIIK